MMKVCHHLGIRNFRTIRQPRRIELAFDLCMNDRSASQYVVSKCHDEQFKPEIFHSNNISMNNQSRKCHSTKHFFTCLLNLIQWLFCLVCVVLKYTNCFLWCLLKMIRWVFSRYQSIRCSHQHCYH